MQATDEAEIVNFSGAIQVIRHLLIRYAYCYISVYTKVAYWLT